MNWPTTFLIVAIIAASLGFSDVPGAETGIAKAVFFIFLTFFVIALILGRRLPPTV